MPTRATRTEGSQDAWNQNRAPITSNASWEQRHDTTQENAQGGASKVEQVSETTEPTYTHHAEIGKTGQTHNTCTCTQRKVA